TPGTPDPNQEGPQSGSAGGGGTIPPTTPGDPLTEESGYTPILNDDGSIARPMWLVGSPANTRFARLTNEQWQRAAKDLLNLSALPTQESQFFENIGAGATDFVNDQSRLQMSNTQWQ